MAVALLALFIAMGGSAVAASHYLINSTGQISPKVLKRLRGTDGAEGAKGLTGALGPAGAKGEAGPEGKQGPEGKAGTPGAEGKPGPKGEAGAGSAGLSDSIEGPITLKAESAPQTVATISNVPAGHYILNAKVTVEDKQTIEEVTIHCYLHAEAKDIDEATAFLAPEAEYGSIETLPLAASQTFAATGSVTLTCNDMGTSAIVSKAQITAVRVQALTATNT
jgi:hypothetical protein